MAEVGNNKKQPTQSKTTNPTDKTSKQTSKQTTTKKEKSAGIKKDDKKTQPTPKQQIKQITKKPIPIDKPLTVKERAFIEEYLKDGNGTQALKRAGYNYKNDGTAAAEASRMLSKPNVAYQFSLLQEERSKKNIADGEEVMRFYTRVMRGEEKDQFGLEVGARDRITAANELAKRTIDIDNRLKGIADQKVDNNIKIQLDWSRE